MLRPIAIALILVLSVGVMLPFTNEAHGVRQTVQVGQRRHHRYRSRAWWRRYRARLRQKRLAAELAHRNATLALPQNISAADLQGLSGPALPSLSSNSATSTTLPPPVMTGSVAPVANHSNGETRPRVVNPAHPAFKTAEAKLPGQMNLAVVALSRPNPAFLTSREEKKMLGGVAVADLRRMVIDKMVSSGGWVVNDFIREVNGARVFVVTARTPKDALTPEKTWTFYFTEAGGRIYGLTTDAPVEYAERMTTEAERFIQSLRAKAVTAGQ
ncbi:MAG TPA: hypothetical protein VGQ41_01755 [Pyrinomonadaceae bacterium]|jgi:hypothetical protein|nr:hypothetical protein [Pyrinomonadaceae bacterium]